MNTQTDTRTESEIIREAWLCQDACNLSGVVHSFSRAVSRLWQIANENNHLGTRWVNEHLACKLFASKIASLTGDLPIELPAECKYENGFI